jgi:hypothetical protein
MNHCYLAADWKGCSMPALALAFSTETLGLQIKTAERAGGELAGPVPTEIARLVPRTKAAITALNAAEEAQKDCLGSTSDRCMQGYFEWDQAHDALMSTLNGWKPFIGG